MSDINHNRMIPLHIADQAVAACEKEIATLKADVQRLEAVIESYKDAGIRIFAMMDEERRNTSHLKAEVERLRASSFVTAVPVEQYERLLKAGDAMADAINEHRHGKGGAWGEGFIVREKWKTAKEGKGHA